MLNLEGMGDLSDFGDPGVLLSTTSRFTKSQAENAMITFSPEPSTAVPSDELHFRDFPTILSHSSPDRPDTGGLPPPPVMLPANAPDVAVARAQHIIETEFQSELSLGTIARRICLSPGHFCKLFKKGTGVNFVDYVTKLRIGKVKSLLQDPRYRISEAAYEVGFQSISQFNRSFRKVVGTSPQSYRTTLALPHTNTSG